MSNWSVERAVAGSLDITTAKAKVAQAIQMYNVATNNLTASVGLRILSNEKDQSILDWLSTADLEGRHKQMKKDRTPNTGKWFLESSEYNDWVRGEGPSTLISQGSCIIFEVNS
jgi:hypothetical protein